VLDSDVAQHILYLLNIGALVKQIFPKGLKKTFRKALLHRSKA